MKHIILSVGLIIALSGCSLGPEYKRYVPNFIAGSSFYNASTITENASPMGQWWTGVADVSFQGDVDKLLNDNLSIQQGAERVIQASERLGLAKGDYAPTLGVETSAGRSFVNNATSGERTYGNSYNAALSSSWQIDLFGKITKSNESAQASLGASIYDQEALKHSLIAQLLQRRVAVATNQKLHDLAKQNVTNRQSVLNVVQGRYDLGAQNADIGDVYLAKDNVSSAKADKDQFQRLLAAEAYQFDVLLGQLPGTTGITKKSFPIVPKPMTINTCLPMDLLDRRPDLKSSELRLMASNADIGVAMADLYPSISLAGSLGFSGADDSSLFTAKNLAGSLIGSITARIFEGGKLRSNIRLQESEAREMALKYSEDILNAVREVETALNADANLKKQIQNQESSVSSLRRAEKIARGRYEDGIQSLQNYLDTQQRRYVTEQSLYRLYQTQWNNRIALYLALGGDWFTGGTPSKNCNNKVS